MSEDWWLNSGIETNTQHNHTKTMKAIIVALLISVSVLVSVAAETNTVTVSPSIAKDSRCFEMRTYYAMPGKLEALNARFRDHTCALFKKHGMENIGYWIPADASKGSTNTLVYILAHKSREAAKASWDAFRNDPDWTKAQKESEANGKLVEKAESVFLFATDYSLVK